MRGREKDNEKGRESVERITQKKVRHFNQIFYQNMWIDSLFTCGNTRMRTHTHTNAYINTDTTMGNKCFYIYFFKVMFSLWIIKNPNFHSILV